MDETRPSRIVQRQMHASLKGNDIGVAILYQNVGYIFSTCRRSAHQQRTGLVLINMVLATFMLCGLYCHAYCSDLVSMDSTVTPPVQITDNQPADPDGNQPESIFSSIMPIINAAEVIVEGHITEIQNLYKKGGCFVKLIVLKVDTQYKGKAETTFQILSRFGYAEKSERIIITNGKNIISLEPGDKGFFFLSRHSVIEQETAGNEKYKDFLKNKTGFAHPDEDVAVLLTKNDAFDYKYSQLVFPDLKMPTLVDFRRELKLIAAHTISPNYKEEIHGY